uniref:Uncharacterized protein n=1 Tax=Anguilla anguilla TaxID=7936 RepID=A0A0E9Q134_ANGAN
MRIVEDRHRVPWNDKERKEWRCGQPWDRREWARADSRLPRLGA